MGRRQGANPGLGWFLQGAQVCDPRDMHGDRSAESVNTASNSKSLVHRCEPRASGQEGMTAPDRLELCCARTKAAQTILRSLAAGWPRAQKDASRTLGFLGVGKVPAPCTPGKRELGLVYPGGDTCRRLFLKPRESAQERHPDPSRLPASGPRRNATVRLREARGGLWKGRSEVGRD